MIRFHVMLPSLAIEIVFRNRTYLSDLNLSLSRNEVIKGINKPKHIPRK